MASENPSLPRVPVVGITGSLRPGSYTRRAVEIALEGAREAGADTKLIDLRDYALAFADGRDDESGFPPDVFRLRRDVAEAKGIVLGTPEYHGGLSGVLKNALDLMGFDEFEGKMIGLVGVSAGPFGALHGLNGLRAVGRALHAWVVPEQASVPEAFKAFDADGKLKSAAVEKRVKDVGRQVARFARLHSSAKAQEFLKAWEEAPLNPGAE